MGVRGSFEEFGSIRVQGIYVRGYIGTIIEIMEPFPDNEYMKNFYFNEEKLKDFEKQESVVNLSDFLLVRISVDGEVFYPWKGKILSWERTLDPKTGVLERKVVWDNGSGKQTRFLFRRFASYENKHKYCMYVSVSPLNYSGKIKILSGIDTKVKTCGQKILREVGKFGDEVMVQQVKTADKYGFEAAIGVKNEFRLNGKNADGAIQYCVCYRIRTDGNTEVIRKKTRVAEATFCEVYLTIQTNFSAGGDPNGAYREQAVLRAERAYEAGYEFLYREHTAFFSEQYGRTAVEFRYPESGRSVDELIKDYPKDKNIELIEKMFNFDKYLIISSSQAGSEPPTLQGIWNATYTPPWDSKYTVNINLEMNYWSVGALNLCGLAEPLFDKLNRLVPNGKVVAREMYGIQRGDAWCLHHNTDLWDVCGAIDGPWGLTPVCGAWLVNTAFDFYLYTGDEELLEKLYTPIKGAAEFFAEFLIDYSSGGKNYKITCPSTSPERTNGKQGYVSFGSMHDNQMIRQLFENYVQTEKVLHRNEALKTEIESLIGQLPPPAMVSSAKVLKEFYFHDNDSAEDTHRHLSHLYGLHPGRVLHTSSNEEWLKAAEYTLDCRSREGDWAGWGIVWRIYLYSRLFRAEKAGKMLDLLFDETKGLLLPNGFAAHPYECGKVFQYDANAGFPGALLEMFISCPKDVIYLLPAVPKRFEGGKICGVRAFGGFIVESLAFCKGEVKECIIVSENGGILAVETAGKRYSFETKKGGRYIVGEAGIAEAGC